MLRTTLPAARLAVAAATAAAAALAVYGAIQIADAQSGQTTVVGIEHVTLGALTTAMLLLIATVLGCGRLAGRTAPAAAAAAGLTLLALLTTVSNVRGEDPSFFAAVAVPSNLLIVGGLAWLAVALRRAGQLPTWLAAALPLSWIFALPGAEVGGGLLAAACWLLVARALHAAAQPQAAVAPRPEAVHA